MLSARSLSTRVALVLTLISCRPLGAQIDDLASIDAGGGQVTIRTTGGATVRATFLADDVVRIQAATGSELADEGSGKSPIVLPVEPDAVTVIASDLGTHRSYSTATVELRIQPSPLLMELRRKRDDRVLWRELRPLRLAEEATTQTLTSDPGERIYGGGQQNGAFEFNGRLMEISYSGGWEEGDRPSPAPFYMSDRGYGVLRNTWSDGVYDFRSNRYLTTTHSESRFDAYYLVADSMHGVLDLYTRLTGRARLLPRWAFGYGDADCYNDGDNVDKPGTVPEGWSDGPAGATPDVVASVAAKYREHDMPGSWILPNDGYGCGYDDLPGVVAHLGELGFRTGLWTESGVEKIAWEVGTAGTRVQKLDVAWTGKGGTWAMDANHDAAQGFLENSDARPFIWTVMGWAGIQRYAVTWTGDQSGSWDYIRWHVPTLVGSGLSGMAYSTGDVDGIFGGSPETFTRDLQWKCFTPVLMGMSGWSKAARKHPWWFDEPYRSINRRYLTLRQRLMPYIYTLARETELTGAPMVRGLMWDHPRDPHAHDHPYQFFLGPDLLVAPVYRSQEASGGWREGVYLPEGRWIDYWTGRVLDAGPEGLTVDVPVDLATLPVLVRAGAILPMAPASLYDGQVATDPLTLDVYPHGESEFVLYEDDGETRAYREGAYSRQRFSVSATRGGIDLSIGAAEGEFEGRLQSRRVQLSLHTRKAPERVLLGGTELPALADRPAFEAAKQGWWFAGDERLGVLHVNLGRLDADTSHEVSVALDPATAPAPAGAYPARPAGDGTIGADELLVVGRPVEEPGHPLENAFDEDPGTWFRTARDQSVAYGPHELTLSLGGRRVVTGLRIAPRNDKHWKYGQVRSYEVYLADVNGVWGEPAASGSLEQTESQQEVRFAPRAARLLRFRVLSTHDDGVDPMVLSAAGGASKRPYEATATVRVGSITISSFRVLEQPLPDRPALEASLVSAAGLDGTTVIMNGLEFEHALAIAASDRHDFRLAGHWQSFRAEAGLGAGTARFQVWGDNRLLWDSAPVTGPATVKPRLDVRGVSVLSLRTVSSQAGLTTHWAEMVLEGFEGDTVAASPGPAGTALAGGEPASVLESVRKLRLEGALTDAAAAARQGLEQADLDAGGRVALHLELARIHDRIGLHQNSRPVAAALTHIEAAAAVEPPDVAARAAITLARADYHYRARDWEAAMPLAEAAVRLFRQAGDRHGEADAVHKEGLIHFQRGEHGPARELFDRSLELDLEGGERLLFCGDYQRHVGFIHLRQGDPGAALPYFQRSLACRREAGATDASLFAANMLASTLLRLGRPEEARPHLLYALMLAEKIDSPSGKARAGLNLGRMYEQAEDAPTARAAYRMTHRVAESIDHGSIASECVAALERLGTEADGE